MRTLALLALVGLASPALAQPADPHAHHHAPPEKPAEPHAGHAMPPQPAPPADPHAHHHTSPAPAEPPPAGASPPPPAPTDHAADRIFPRADMERARRLLRGEHGDIRWGQVMVERAEHRAGDGGGFAWEARASYGGDIHRMVLKTEGEAASGDLHEAEVQALYAQALGPYFNLQAGLRHDLRPRPRRTYLTAGVEGLAPYWFDVEAAVFLSDEGEFSARLEGGLDLRLTQRLILEPRAEADLAAQDVPELGVGAGLSSLELGLRLRYAVTPEFAPYVGVNWARKLGDTADFARAAGEDVEDTRFVVGLRAWF